MSKADLLDQTRPGSASGSTTPDAPLVSVIIPCYGQAHFLRAAIDSVLAQTHPRMEAVVVDDGSPDNAAEIAGRYPSIRCVRQENQGISKARNAGFHASRGEYVIFRRRRPPNANSAGDAPALLCSKSRNRFRCRRYRPDRERRLVHLLTALPDSSMELLRGAA